MELPTNLTNKPNTQVKDYYLFMSMKPFRSAEWWTFIFQNGRNSISDISSPKMGVGNQQSKHHSVEGEISIVQSIQHGFLLSLGSQTSIEANKSTMLRAEWTITASQAVICLAQMKYRYFVSERCKQNSIFQVQGTASHQTGHIRHISKTYRQTGDILWDSSKGTAATKWRMTFQDNFANTADCSRYRPQNFTVTLFQLYAKNDFNA